MMKFASAALGAVVLAGAAPAAVFVATGSGPIVAYFDSKSADYTEVLGLEINGVGTGVTGLNNQTSTRGNSLNLGTAKAGDVLTFFINVQPVPASVRPYTVYSDPTRNSDLREHVRVTAFAGDSVIPTGTAVGFEDAVGNGSDFDYNDLRFVFTNVTSVPTVPAAVPEPASWAMMIAGFGLMGATMRRRKAAVSFA